MTEATIGIDISKDRIDVHRLPGGESRQFANDKTGLRAFLRGVERSGEPPARIVFEATGAYHRALERRLAEAGLPVVKVNPRNARRFAEAAGRLAKTDRIDAAFLARMGVALSLEPCAVLSQTLSDLKQMIVAREALIKDRTAAKNRAKVMTIAVLKRQNAERLKQIERQLVALDTEIEAQIAAEPDLAPRLGTDRTAPDRRFPSSL
ncbi:transposase [Fulvimarina sp. 2208YS6-2-32]|uniref:Transposase n=1 Tax=Fulvimarina uroteuthidis TaxID=3098149 RepID=A0ABU5I7T5_9HYPH|nr:transposase [Fulvimarina sp. 2208YS6-2-32]MDY8110949.1 transposase [Fulvimarina sp. 2208YS6-2-32]